MPLFQLSHVLLDLPPCVNVASWTFHLSGGCDVGAQEPQHCPSDVNKDWTCKDKDKDKDQAYKDQDKD